MLSWLVGAYRHILQPIPPFNWFGLSINALDLIGALRLCIFLRQARELALRKHVNENGKKGLEEDSFMKKAATTLLVAYGGETMTGANWKYLINKYLIKIFLSNSCSSGYPTYIHAVGCHPRVILVDSDYCRISARNTCAWAGDRTPISYDRCYYPC